MTTSPTCVRAAVLVVAPMPLFPTNSGSRRRLLSTCDFLKRAGFEVDFAYLAHEDQVYTRFGQHPPTDIDAMAAYFRNFYLIEFSEPIRLRTGADAFDIDDWCPSELDQFVELYFSKKHNTTAILVNYVFLSRCLNFVPQNVLKLIDTHDRFGDRKLQYFASRTQANFFHTSAMGEAAGLKRADTIIAIQPAERSYFQTITDRPVALLLPEFQVWRRPSAPRMLKKIGFFGHGNDANVVSIRRFIDIWKKVWRPGLPRLFIAGEVCNSLPDNLGEPFEVMGYVDDLGSFLDNTELIIAPILFGTGLKLKVVEALSYGKPVVGTSIAFHGIETECEDHRLPSIDTLSSRIIELCYDQAALCRLTEKSQDVFAQYRKIAADASDELATSLQKHRERRLELVPECPDSPISAEEIEVQTNTSGDFSASELIATQFSPFDSSRPSSALPARLVWTIQAQTKSSCGNPPFNNQKLRLSPLLSRQPPMAEQERLSWIAARMIVPALPDWTVVASTLVIESGIIAASFIGPNFLLRMTNAARIFLISDAKEANELTHTRFSHRMKSCGAGAKYSPVIDRRCGDTPISGMFVSAKISTTPYCGRAEALVIIAHGLWGLVKFVKIEGEKFDGQRDG